MAEADNLYFRILGELYRHPALRDSERESYAQLANNLGVDDNTVRSALERMQKSGFLKTWSASLNPHVLGMECESILVNAGEGTTSKQKMISQLQLVEGVVLILSFLDNPGFRLVFYYKDEADLENKTQLFFNLRGGHAICGLEDSFSPVQDEIKENRLADSETSLQRLKKERL